MRPTSARSRSVLSLVLLLAGGLLSGCVSKGTPVTRFYVLSPLGSAVAPLSEANRSDPLSVEIVPLRLPQYLNRPQIVTRAGGNELELAEFHQWGGNLAKNMTRVLARNLAQLLATPDIAIFPSRPPAPADVRIEVEVLQFERASDGRVHFSAQWRLQKGRDRAPLLARITDLVSPAVDTATGLDDTVAAMSALLGELSRIIARAAVEAVRVPG